MEKKVYIAPTIELFEIESEGSILQGSVIVTVAKDDEGNYIETDAENALSNKRQPWGSSPWE